MKKSLLFLSLAMSPCFGATVTRLRVINSLSTGARLDVRISATTIDGIRTRVIQAGGAGCTGGTGGFVQVYGSSVAKLFKNSTTVNLSALKPSTTYDACVEVLESSVWSSGVGVQVTTTALPSAITEAEIASVTIPAANGSTVTIESGHCDDVGDGLQKAINDAALLLPTTGTTIKLTEHCEGLYSLVKPGNVKTISAVRTSDGRITTTAAHGLTDGDEIRIGSTGCNPGTLLFRGQLNCYKAAGGWRRGQRLYADYIDTTHFYVVDVNGVKVPPGYVEAIFDATADTILMDPNYLAVNSADPTHGWAAAGTPTSIPSGFVFQLIPTAGSTLPTGLAVDIDYCTKAATNATVDTLQPVAFAAYSGGVCGTAINLSDAGTGTFTVVDQGNGTLYVMAAPSPTGQFIHITSDVKTKVPPVGRIDHGDVTTFGGGFRRASRGRGSGASISNETLASNYVFEQVEWDTAETTATAIGVVPYCAFLELLPDNENIVIQQSRFKGAPPASGNRMGCPTVMNWDGRNRIIRNSEFVNFHYYRPRKTGLTPTLMSTTKVRLAAGSAFTGAAFFGAKTTSTVGDLDITGGSSTGTFTAQIYFDMTGVLRAILPTGLTATWTVTGVTTAVATAGTPAMPTSGGCNAGLIMATATVVNGQFTAVADGDYDSNGSCSQSSEGTSGIVDGNGTGPALFENNYVEWSGLFLHHDDSGGTNPLRFDSVDRRNYFYQPDFTIVNTASSDGMSHGTRQPIESKGTQNWLIDGNIFNGCASNGANPSGVCIAHTPRAGGVSSNNKVTNNFVRRAQAFFSGCAPTDPNPPTAPPCENMEVSNNVVLLAGYDYRNTSTGHGKFIASSYAQSGLQQINHNTVYDPRGDTPNSAFFEVHPVYNWTAQNNVFAKAGNADFINSSSVPGVSVPDYAGLQGISTDGPGGAAKYTMGGNIIVPTYNDTYLASPSAEPTRSTMCTTAFNGSYNAGTGACTGSDMIAGFALGATVADRWAWLDYEDPAAFDFRLKVTSPLIGAGVAGANVGVDWGVAQAAQGVVRSIAITPSSGTASATYVAPNTNACYVGYSSDGGTTFGNYTSDGGGSTSRTTPITGLLASTSYYGNVRCSFEQTAALGYSGNQLTTQAFTTAASTGIDHSRILPTKSRLGGGYKAK